MSTSPATAATGADELTVVVRDRVAYVTIDRPARRNALSIDVNRRLVETFVALDEDDDVWAIVLSGAGDRAFCSGADLQEMEENQRLHGVGPRRPMRSPRRDVHEVVFETTKPTIAVMNGPALGAGFELALACDLRVAAEHAWVSLPEAKRGLGSNFGSVMLTRLLPRALALELLYLGEPLSAQDALRWGLFNRVVPAEDLEATAEELVRALVANAPLSVRRFKNVATKAWSLPVAAALRLDLGPDTYGSEDRVEGVAAFNEGRAPRWAAR
ncbi:enoyl-CoA hydratase-related protein [Patulibacter sp. NPDC049589]|uniref:enoyl-CoA hydratase/isomerase family protein n=1 Tax=Patulibacter sp. NPDC049589 TaxID=3154731 RepID=UPI003417CCC3